MNTQKLLRLLCLTLAIANTTACTLLGDRRDAPWDPKPGHSLLDQIPNNVGSGRTLCGGQMTPEERLRTGASPRC